MSLTLKFLLLFLLVLSHHAESGSLVKFLPGFEGPLPFELETGYVGIGEQEELQYFYYFIKSENNPQEDPLLIWLSGGPGCSSLVGLSYENGPMGFKFEAYNGSLPSLVSTTYSWTKVANIIYLDQPVGAGFSYSKTPLIDTSSDTDGVKRIHEFLQKWLSNHPKFFSNPFYVAGDSYSGAIVPALVQEISNGNYLCCKPLINLQGYILGNPLTHYKVEQNYRIPYAHGMALISNELYESMKRICKGNYYGNVDSGCLELVEKYHKYHPYFLLAKWANNKSVRKALHVNKETVDDWVRCNETIKRLYNRDIQNSVPYHMNNSINGYKSLIFSGDHDMLIPFIGTQAWILSLNYSIIDEWRPWMINDQIAGYMKSYANKMTFATVKGGGHTTEYKPNESFIMFQRWISGKPL